MYIEVNGKQVNKIRGKKPPKKKIRPPGFPSCPFRSLWATVRGQCGELRKGRLSCVRREIGPKNLPTPPCEMTTSPRSLPSLKHKGQENGGQRKFKERTPHRCGWRVGDDGARYGASCCHEQRCLRVRGSRQQGIQGRRRGRLIRGPIRLKDESKQGQTYREHQRQHVGRSCPSSGDDGHDRRGIGDQPLRSEIGICQ